MLCPLMGVRKVQLEYCYKGNLFAPSDDNLTLQKYKHFLIPQAFRRYFSLFLPNKNKICFKTFVKKNYFCGAKNLLRRCK